jgi:hypothetical protein
MEKERVDWGDTKEGFTYSLILIVPLFTASLLSPLHLSSPYFFLTMTVPHSDGQSTTMNGNKNAKDAGAFLSRDPFVAQFTRACQATAGPTADARTKQVLDSLMAHIHNFVKEIELTSEEWLIACNALAEAGKITSEKRNEFILISDVLGIESLVDSLAQKKVAVENGKITSTAVLGPFYRTGAPVLEKGSDIVQDHSTTDKDGRTGEKVYMYSKWTIRATRSNTTRLQLQRYFSNRARWFLWISMSKTSGLSDPL